MKQTHKRKTIDNSLTELVAGVQMATLMTGGSTLSSYGTVGYSNNYSLVTLNRIILTYMYTGNGIFQTAVQLPIQDALSKGIEIESGEMDAEEVEMILEWIEENGIFEKIIDYYTWTRLFGGGALIINSNQDPETPLNLKGLQNTPVEFYDVDRWQLDSTAYGTNDFDSWIFDKQEHEFYYFFGTKIHESRVIKSSGKKAPSYVNRSLRGWGMSEGERMIRDINLYLKTQDVTYEILDESKIDVYKIQGLANKLLTSGGTQSVMNRITAANQLKNYVSALVLDAAEEFEQKTMSFAGLAEVMNQNRIGIAAALRMPVTKLFGLSASGFNSGESDLENYNSMVESEIRAKLRPALRKIVEIATVKLFGYTPSFKIKFPTLRVLTALEEEQIKTSKTNRILAFYDRGIIDSKEVGEVSRKESLLTIETKAEQGLLPPQPTPPNGSESVMPVDTNIKADK